MVRVDFPCFDIQKIAESGQCFRLVRSGQDDWTLTAFGKALHIRKIKNGEYIFSCTKREFNSIWKNYFDLESDYGAYADQIPKSDRFLSAAAEYSEGIRILNQDPWEMLITFLLSQRKSIPAIRTCVEKLASSFGNEINDDGKTVYAFPTPEQLYHAGVDGILSCSAGYRAPYLYEAASLVLSGELDPEYLKNSDDAELKEKLLSLRGVGEKVANCVMLFGYHRINAFPVDVWMNRMIDRHYNGSFPMDLYRGFAGIIQQYIFYYGRTYSGH